jgi:hypothetical protein
MFRALKRLRLCFGGVVPDGGGKGGVFGGGIGVTVGDTGEVWTLGVTGGGVVDEPGVNGVFGGSDARNALDVDNCLY